MRDTSFARELDRMVRIERPVANGGFDGAGSGEWVKVADVRAGVRDILPSRGEDLGEGISILERPARVRMRWREDVTSAMRFRIGRPAADYDESDAWETDRIVQITSGPAELGRRKGLEFMVVEYRPAGNGA